MSIRDYLNATVRPLLPSGWVVYDYDRTLTTISKVTVVYVHKSIEPAPETGLLLHTVSLVVADPTQAEQKADDRLDDILEDLIPALTAASALQFVRADKGMRDTYPAWDIQVQIKTNA